MIPNICLTNVEKHFYSNGLYGGFIRPEDVDTYNKYVDVLEIVGHDK